MKRPSFDTATMALLLLVYSALALPFEISYVGTSPERFELLAGVGSIPETEYTALYSLYNSTDGPHWDWRNLSTGRVEWNFEDGSDPCKDSWQGVDCVVLGTPPNDIYYVRSIDLRQRNLTGPLPDNIGDLPHLDYLNLPRMKINGTLPESMRQLRQLAHIEMQYNALSGNLPAYFGELAQMRTLIFTGNKLTGTIPNELCNLTELSILYLNSNQMRGTIPYLLGNVTSLVYLDVDTNSLSGSIPLSFANLTRIRFMGLHSNKLTGTIPDFLGRLDKLQFLYLNNEQFRGTIPSSLGQLPQLLFLHLHYNQLTGTIPSSLGSLPRIEYIYLNDNQLTGSLPPEISQLSQLTSILVQGNQLTGTLEYAFNHTIQKKLTTIQVSNNHFTGTLPAALFQLEQLTTLIAVSNCIHGSLPSTVCDPVNLETLVLDGIQSSIACLGYTVPGFDVSTRRTGYFSGTVPTCLFQLPALNTLHLSGNSLTGSLPRDLVFSQRLLDLDLSHNLITGSIPTSIQRTVWYNLDLSYNRFTGLMVSDFYTLLRNFTFHTQFEQYYVNSTLPVTSAALNLQNNRLSGDLPNNIKNMVNISVLDGNLFSCTIDKNTLPRHDGGERKYQCASNSFDIPYYIWLAFTGALCGTVAVLWYFRSELDQYFKISDTAALWVKWLKILTHENGLPRAINARLQSVSYVALVCDAICRVSVLAAAFVLFVLLPVYSIVSTFYGTHSRQYSYTVSATFQSGVPPFALEFVLLFIFLLMIDVSFTRSMGKVAQLRAFWNQVSIDTSTSTTVDDSSVRNRRANRFERFTVRFAFFAINVVVVLGVNIAFVYVALYQSSVLLIFAQVLLSLFKFTWNLICMPFLIRWTSHYLVSTTSDDQKSRGRSGFFSLQLFVSLFNNIAIPCLVVMVVDPNCFYNVLVPADSETSHYLYAECKIYTFAGCEKVVPQIASATYNPSFTYSYQCSSSFVTYYAPAFVYVCFVATFVAPVLQIVAQKIHAWLPHGTLAFRLLDFCLPRVLQPLQEGPVERNVFKPYLDGNLVLVTLLTYVGIMMTFGAVFPPLAAAVFVTIIVVAYFAKLKIGRMITNVVDAGLYNYLDIIETECVRVGSVRKLRQSLWMLMSFSCVFYTLFLFDTLGNVVGFFAAAWVIIVVPLAPLYAYIASILYEYYVSDHKNRTESAASGVLEGVELEANMQFSDAKRLARELKHDTTNVMHGVPNSVDDDSRL